MGEPGLAGWTDILNPDVTDGGLWATQALQSKDFFADILPVKVSIYL